MSATAQKVDWRLKQVQIASCNCDWNCPCQFAMAKPTHDGCEAFEAFEVSEGHYGDTDMAGVKWGWMLHWPGAIHEGNGHRMLVLDPSTNEAQREAMIALTDGTQGHPFLEIFSLMAPNRHDPVIAAITIEVDFEARSANVSADGVGATKISAIPAKPAGTKRVRLDMPEGFEFKLAEIANGESWHIDGPGPLTMSHENTYAQLVRSEWASDGSTR